MALTIVRGDVTKIRADAIVNSTGVHLIPGGGVDEAIHAAAGPELAAELRRIGTCDVGSAVITGSYALTTCKYVIHTVGPTYKDGKRGEPLLLKSCYESILTLAREKGCTSLAIPSISSGAKGFPRAEAYRIATGCIRDFLANLPENEDMMVYLVLYRGETLDVVTRARAEELLPRTVTDTLRRARAAQRGLLEKPMPSAASCVPSAEPAPREPWDGYEDVDLSFADMCDWWCERKSISKTRFYIDANINKAMFWNMKHHPEQVPKKTNVLACAVGLKLDLAQTRDLLMRAGLTLSPYYELDRVVEKYISANNYDVDMINAALFERDLALLGTF